MQTCQDARNCRNQDYAGNDDSDDETGVIAPALNAVTAVAAVVNIGTSTISGLRSRRLGGNRTGDRRRYGSRQNGRFGRCRRLFQVGS